MEAIKKIDIHAHAIAFPDYVPRNRWGTRMCSGEEVIRFYDELNIEKGVLLPISSPEAQITPMTSEACKYIADQHPDRFLWFCNVDPRAVSYAPDADLSLLLSQYKAMGAKGVGEMTAHVYADDPLMDNLLGCCVECDMPFLFHMAPSFGGFYGIIDEIGMPRLEKMMKKHPDLKVIGHSQAFWSEISATITEEKRNCYNDGKVVEGRLAQLLREYGNLYCDLSAGSGSSALMRDPEYAARFVEEFSDRLLYGCDICGVDNTHQYIFNDFLDKMVADGMISPENYRKIVRENAIKLLKLED